MKKVIAIFAIATLAACGNGTSTTSKVDSTKVSADTTVKAVDSVVAKQIKRCRGVWPAKTT